MANVVLTQGAFHGGWCWRDSARMLRAHGHEVLTSSLTGLGDRAPYVDRYFETASAAPHWTALDCDWQHNAFMTDPGDFVDLLERPAL